MDILENPLESSFLKYVKMGIDKYFHGVCILRQFLLSQDQAGFLSPSGTPGLFMLPHDSSPSESIFYLGASEVVGPVKGTALEPVEFRRKSVPGPFSLQDMALP